MSNAGRPGVLYAEYARLVTQAPFLSVWSYRSQEYEAGRHAIVRTAAGDQELEMLLFSERESVSDVKEVITER